MSKRSKPDGEPIVIKRYASRKLYDADAKVYVTLEDIARYIREGREVQIIDKGTGEDLTRQYLVQIIADFESQGESALPLNILTDLVRHYQEQANSVTSTFAGAMTPAFLGQMFEAYKEQQEKALSELGELGGKAMDPEKMMGTMNDTMRDWQEKQSEFFSQAMAQWGAGLPQQSPAGERETEGESGPPPEPAQKEAKIKAIEENLEALQEQLKKLR